MSSIPTIISTQTLTTPTAPWSGVSMSCTGKYQSAVFGQFPSNPRERGYIYTSNDYGKTWIQRTSLFRYWLEISISNSGKYQTAVANGNIPFDGVGIYISSDYGVTWTWNNSITGSTNNTYAPLCVAVSSSGKYQISGGSGTLNYRTLLVSSDYGQNWTVVSALFTSVSGTPSRITKVAISATGKYQAAISSMGHIVIYVSTDYGVTWNIKTTPGFILWSGIAFSEDGSILTATILGGYIYISRDYGDTWVQKDIYANWNNIVVSANGQYQAATTSNSFLYISTNYGDTWTSFGTVGAWGPLSMSPYGLNIIASKDRKLYQFSNSSKLLTNWIPNMIAPVNVDWSSISLSYDGQYQVANISGGNTWISSNYGVVWSDTNLSGYNKTVLSSTGQYQLTSKNNSIFVSSNYGTNWITPSIITYGNPINPAISANGQYQLIGDGSGGNMAILISNDFGSSWNKYDLSGNSTLYSVSFLEMSSTGQYQFCVYGNWNNGNYVEYSTNYGVSWDYSNISTNIYEASGNSGINIKGASYSTDGTYEIIEKYTKKYSFIKSYRKKDNNLYEALNFGIKNLKE